MRSRGIKLNKEWGEKKTPLLPDDYDKVDCEYHLGFESSLKARQFMHGMRFMIFPVRHEDYNHWTACIWDRKKGHLYHFDSLLSDQKVRLNCTLLAVREFHASTGQNFTYRFYQIPISQQAEGWECGLVCAYCVSQAIRGLVGASCDQVKTIHQFQSLMIDRVQPEEPEPFDLLLSDWVPGLHLPTPSYKTKIRRGLVYLKGFYQQLILMELGILDSKFIQQYEDADPELVTYKQSGSITYRVLKQAPGAIEVGDLYTNQGGFLTIWSSVHGYEKNWSRDRIMPIPSGERATLMGHLVPMVLPNPVFPLVPQVNHTLGSRGIDFTNNIPVRPVNRWQPISLLDDDQTNSCKKDLALGKIPSKLKGDPKSEDPGKTSPVASTDPSAQAKPRQKPVPLSSRAQTPASLLDQMVLTTPKGPAAPRPSPPPVKESPAPSSRLSSPKTVSTPPWSPSMQQLMASSSPGLTPRIPKSTSDTTMKDPTDSDGSLPPPTPRGHIPPSRSDISMRDVGSSDYHTESESSSERTSKASSPSDQIPPPVAKKPAAKRRPVRGPIDNIPPTIEGGTLVAIEDVPSENVEQRMRNVPAGTLSMSVRPGVEFELINLPSQETTNLGDGRWLTYIPDNITTGDHWDEIFAHLGVELTEPQQAPGPTREERMAQREQKKKDWEEGKGKKPRKGKK